MTSLSRAMAGTALLLTSTAAWAGEGLVALVTRDPSCRNDSGDRYVDCGNGTITDNETGLVWLANASCFERLSWWQAMFEAASLSDLPGDRGACHKFDLTPDECDCGLSDGSSPGDWRLPSIAEWLAMIEHAPSICDPRVTSDSGGDCWDEDCVAMGVCSLYGVQSASYWSSSPFVPLPESSWWIFLGDGNFSFADSYGSLHVWPVRGGGPKATQGME